MSVVAYDRPAFLPVPADAGAPQLDFGVPAGVLQRAGSDYVIVDQAGCTVGRLQPNVALVGWAALEQNGRSLIAYVVSAIEPNRGDFVLYNHWLRIVEVNRSGPCPTGSEPSSGEFPIVDVGPFSAPAISGIAFGKPSSRLDQQLVIHHADPVGTYSTMPWSREALQATMCGIIAASKARGDRPNDGFGSTTYRLLKQPADSVIRELEKTGGACPPRSPPNARPDAPLTSGALASGEGSHHSAAKP